jgi:hypothetical protein
MKKYSGEGIRKNESDDKKIMNNDIYTKNGVVLEIDENMPIVQNVYIHFL